MKTISRVAMSAVLLVLATACAPSSFSYDSSPGEPFANGVDGSYTSPGNATIGLLKFPNGDFTFEVRPNGGGLWQVTLGPPTGQALQVGHAYTNTSWNPDATHAFLTVSRYGPGSGPGCSPFDQRGTFIVQELKKAPDGHVTRFVAQVISWCLEFNPLDLGLVYNAL
jgi:hypothetical protein